MVNMHVLLFIAYSVALGYCIYRVPFFRNCGIRRRWLLLFFALHVIVGCVHTVIAFRYYPGHGDVWDFYQRSLETRQFLTTNPRQFLNENSTWTYLTHNGIIVINTILDSFSFDNLYINTLLFSFPIFLGNIALFRVFKRRFPDDNLAALSTLLLPSTLFWISCVHREGTIFALLGLFFYCLDRLLSEGWEKRPAWYSLLLFVGIVYFRPIVVSSLLPAVLVWIWMEKRTRPDRSPAPPSLARSPLSWLIPLLLLAPITLIFWPSFSDPLLRALSSRQKEFQALEGGSRLYLPVLEANWNSLLHVLPTALRNGFFEPLPGSGGKKIYMAFSIELLAIWAVIACAIFRRVFRIGRPGAGPLLKSRTDISSPLTGNPGANSPSTNRSGANAPMPGSPGANSPLPSSVGANSPLTLSLRGRVPTPPKDPLIMNQMLQPISPSVFPPEPPTPLPSRVQLPPTFPFAVACIVFAVITLLQIGMIIPFAGAIVRYRSIALPFLLAPFLYSLRHWRPFDRLSKTLSEHIFSP